MTVLQGIGIAVLYVFIGSLITYTIKFRDDLQEFDCERIVSASDYESYVFIAVLWPIAFVIIAGYFVFAVIPKFLVKFIATVTLAIKYSIKAWLDIKNDQGDNVNE